MENTKHHRIERRVILDQKTLFEIVDKLKNRSDCPEDCQVVINVHWHQEYPDSKVHGATNPVPGECYVQVIIWENAGEYEPLTKNIRIDRHDERTPGKQILESL